MAEQEDPGSPALLDAGTSEPAPVIDLQRNLRGYRRLARFYDLLAVPPLTARQRREAVAQLALPRGGSVLDLGCGTGLSLTPLVAAVGPDGRVVGVDLSPDQLARARRRVEAAGWTNVLLIEANAEELALNESFDGILSTYTHDIMTSRRAIGRAVRHLKPGGRFVAVGFKRPTGWSAPLNLLVKAFYTALRIPIQWDRETSRRPWAYPEELLGPLDVRERFGGLWYEAVGVKLSGAAEGARSLQRRRSGAVRAVTAGSDERVS